MKIQSPITQEKADFRKIKKTCEVAEQRGYAYAWIDTCCIDKTSSAMLSEAINSMFHWYKESSMCFTYLEDLDADVLQHKESEMKDLLKQCRWFTRGWTLQELIAPEEMEFYDTAWKLRGTKRSLGPQLSEITGIQVDVLGKSDLLPSIPVGRKMSWAAGRKTTRVEDIAYCLLGIFDNEFEVDRRPVHRSYRDNNLRGILASNPSQFADCRTLEIAPRRTGAKEFTMTNNGLRINTALGSLVNSHIFDLDCIREGRREGYETVERIGIYLKETELGYVRERSAECFTTTDLDFWKKNSTAAQDIYIARTLSKISLERLLIQQKRQRSRSMKFHFNLSPTGTYSVKSSSLKARPSALWNVNDKNFLTETRKTFTAVVEFTIRPRYWRFVIVCGLIDVDSDAIKIKDVWDDNDNDDVCPWMAIFTDQDPVAKSQMDIIDKLRAASDNLTELRDTVLSWYRGKDGYISIRAMAETVKTAFDEDEGNLQYNMDMLKSEDNGTQVFNIRVFVTQLSMVNDTATNMADVGVDETPDYQHSDWGRPYPPTTSRTPDMNPFMSRAPPPQQPGYPGMYSPGAQPPYGYPTYGPTYPQAFPFPSQTYPSHSPYYQTGYGRYSGRPPGY
ncbi:hypothetical protein N0V82_000853 [Gnomoniopsis sp. IMI 355080]|nr:hypothetical protein N0V82_000853 [Gnomoniopsis sp. IMI 355080]